MKSKLIRKSFIGLVIASFFISSYSFGLITKKHFYNANNTSNVHSAELDLERIIKPIDLPKVENSSDSHSLEQNLLSYATTADDSHNGGVPWQKVTVKAGDTFSKIASQQNIPVRQVHTLLTAGKQSKTLAKLQPKQDLKFLLDDENNLQKMEYVISPYKSLQFVYNAEQEKFNISEIEHPVETRLTYADARIQDSLYKAATHAGVNERLIMQLTDIFSWDVDFALDVRPGDSFKILYEEKFVQGKKVENGNIVAAEFNNQGKKYHAVYYTDDTGHSDYYDDSGRSLKKAFIRTPVKFTRISSRFSLGRRHPVLHTLRAHRGVDYAAPHGTPVKATGKGKIAFIGRKGGYGKVIMLQHGKKYMTVYGHLSRFAKHLRVGSKINQGQVIAYVGSTGLATGPHLHYEFRVNGVHRNPLTVALPRSKPIKQQQLAHFKHRFNETLALLDHHATLQVATAVPNS